MRVEIGFPEDVLSYLLNHRSYCDSNDPISAIVGNSFFAISFWYLYRKENKRLFWQSRNGGRSSYFPETQPIPKEFIPIHLAPEDNETVQEVCSYSGKGLEELFLLGTTILAKGLQLSDSGCRLRFIRRRFFFQKEEGGSILTPVFPRTMLRVVKK